MYKYLIVLIICLTVCYADDTKDVDNQVEARKKSGVGYIYGGGILTYLTFLAIKVKIALIIGSIIAAVLIFGKLFALIKYGHYFFEKKHEYDQPERVVYIDPHSHGDYYSASDPGITFDSPPPHYLSSGSDHYSDHSEYSAPPDHSDHSDHSDHYPTGPHDRSFETPMDANIDMMKEVFKRMDLTEYAFDSLDVKTEACKKQFVCEADFRAKENSLLALGVYMFGNTGFSKYRGKSPVSSIDDCAKLYPECKRTT